MLASVVGAYKSSHMGGPQPTEGASLPELPDMKLWEVRKIRIYLF